MEYLYSEILDMFEKAPTKKEKIDVLKKFEHPTFKEFFNYALNPSIVFVLPVVTS